MQFCTYIVLCSDASYYVGHTDKLDRRISEHNSGGVSVYTRRRRPVKLVWSEQFATREDAKAVEKQIKGWSRAKKEALIKENWDRLRTLARSF